MLIYCYTLLASEYKEINIIMLTLKPHSHIFSNILTVTSNSLQYKKHFTPDFLGSK